MAGAVSEGIGKHKAHLGAVWENTKRIPGTVCENTKRTRVRYGGCGMGG